MPNLPVELWTEIALHCRKRELCNLCISSRHISAPARIVLYRNVELVTGRDLCDFDPVLALLRSAGSDLSRHIRSFSLRDLAEITANMIPFERMPNLSSLTVDNCAKFLSSTEDLHIFLDNIETHCKELRKVNFDTRHISYHRPFSLSHIRYITWKERVQNSSRNETGLPLLRSLCETSTASITHLSIDLGPKPVLQSFLDNIHLPALIFLDTALSRNRPHDHIPLPSPVITFLCRHTTIQSLRLQYAWNERSDSTSILLAGDDSILPNLAHIDAHPNLLTFFLDRGARFMQRVKSISVSDALYTSTYYYIECLFTSLQQHKSSVRHVRVLPRVHSTGELYISDSEFKVLMELLANALPELESWAGDIPDDEGFIPNLSDVIESFSHFTRLREMSLYSPIFEPGHGLEYEEVKEFVNKCSKVEVIKIGHRVDAVHTHYLIDRGKNGDVSFRQVEIEIE